jgi:esterase/lipase superfamily enzyme
MDTEYHAWWSSSLGQDMALKIYGHAGKATLVFPAQGGRFYEYEDFGMVDACAPFVEAGKIQLFTVDSIDNQSWANWTAHPAERAQRHNAYDRYVVEEVAPFIRGHGHDSEKILTTGVSMGAYHAANFLFRHPDVFDATIALSGIFRLNLFIGDYTDENVYLNTPLAYLPGLDDPSYLDQYRQSQIIVCAGQGPWEDEMLADARELQEILGAKDVPCWVDIWGYDVEHDWPWWRRQMPYFLQHLKS